MIYVYHTFDRKKHSYHTGSRHKVAQCPNITSLPISSRGPNALPSLPWLHCRYRHVRLWPLTRMAYRRNAWRRSNRYAFPPWEPHAATLSFMTVSAVWVVLPGSLTVRGSHEGCPESDAAAAGRSLADGRGLISLFGCEPGGSGISKRPFRLCSTGTAARIFGSWGLCREASRGHFQVRARMTRFELMKSI